MHSDQKERLRALWEPLSADERRRLQQKAARLRKAAEKEKRIGETRRQKHSWDEDEIGGIAAMRGRKQEPLEKWLLKALEDEQRLKAGASTLLQRESPESDPAAASSTAASSTATSSNPATPEPGNTTVGIVAGIGSACCRVMIGHTAIPCLLKPDLIQTQKITLAVGDLVTIRRLEAGRGLVLDVHSRQNAITRPDPHCPEIGRAMAANLDAVVLVSSARDPEFRPGMIDRMLVSAFAGEIKPILAVNKIDLLTPIEQTRFQEQLTIYRRIGICVFPVSAQTGEGTGDLRAELLGRQSAFIGHSGVGKSSLLNCLFPNLTIKTNSVRESDGKGRHTTTAAELHMLSENTRIIDCPGVREFSVGHFSLEQIRKSFPEMRASAEKCRFADCSHTLEPDCAVRAAVAAGDIAQERYRSYRKLLGGPAEEGEQGSIDFVCEKCGYRVSDHSMGTRKRNHCPRCLWSRHLDHRPGDRASGCDGLMEPVTVWVRKKGEWAIIHRCLECGTLRSNRIAGDDNEVKLLSLAMKPLAEPPFPLDHLERAATDPQN
jgi:ribosome biogenesis GTPase